MAQLTREQFVQQVIEVVRDRFPAAKVARAAEPFSLRVNGQITSLENVYRSAMLKPSDTTGLIEQWILELIRTSEGSPDHNAGYEELAERILPTILREDSPDAQSTSIVTQPLVSGLSLGYVVDSDRSFWYVPKTTLESWNVSTDTLHERAMENLVNRSQAITAHAAQDDDGKINLILFQTGDGFDASRLLLPTLHERLREHLGSPFLAGVPNRGILLCFRHDPTTLGRLQKQIRTDYGQMPHPITDKLFLITPDGIAPFFAK